MSGRENSEAITAVIEKLTEIVGSNESTQDGFERHTGASEMESGCEEKKEGEVEILIEVPADASQPPKPLNAVLTNVQNLLPSECKTGSVNLLPLSCGGSSQKEKETREQMVLNFPIKLANLNIASPQGLLETLQKLNTKLKVGMKEVDLVELQPCSQQEDEKAGDEKDMEDCELRMLFRCSKCNYSSHNKHYLKQHTGLVHNAERLYKCPFCDYAGKRSYSLKEHLIVHSTYRPYECSFCNASFRKKGHLTNHVKMHSSQKTLACVLCHASVQSRTQLYEHLRHEHDADNVYACDICEYATAIKSNIVMHMHTHGDPKVYKCCGCQFMALHINIIRQHLKAVHRDNGTVYSVELAPEKPCPLILMKCSECGYTCNDKEVLKDHILQQHIDVSAMMEGLNEESVDAEAAGEQVGHYRCVQCNYTNSEAYPFITHILSHKPKVPLTQALQEEGDQAKVSSPTEDAGCAGATAPGTTMPRQRFTHDASNGMYRCAICNYTCEFQRTIKAHIWKHSGHKDIDYPMFQNGPLSVYDDTPVGMSILLSSKAPVSHVASSAMADSVAIPSPATETKKSERNTDMTSARPVAIAPKKALMAKAITETPGSTITKLRIPQPEQSSFGDNHKAESTIQKAPGNTITKLPILQPEESSSGDKYKGESTIRKAVARISNKGPVMVILSAAEKRKQQQDDNAATALADGSLKEVAKLSAPEVSNDSDMCSDRDHSARPASNKVVLAPAVKTTRRPLVTLATTVQAPPVKTKQRPLVTMATTVQSLLVKTSQRPSVTMVATVQAPPVKTTQIPPVTLATTVQAPPVKTTQRPSVTMATTVHIVQSPASRNAATPKSAAGDLNHKGEEAVGSTTVLTNRTDLLTNTTDLLTNTSSKRKLSKDGSLSDNEDLQVVAKKRPAEGSYLVQPLEMSNKTNGGKSGSDVVEGHLPKLDHARKKSDVVKVIALSDVRKVIEPIPKTLYLQAVRGSLEMPEDKTADSEQQNSDKENVADPKNVEKTKEKALSVEVTPPLGVNHALDGACCSSNMSCENDGETPGDEDGSKPSAGICQSLLAVIEQLRSRSDSEGDYMVVDGGTKRKRKLSDDCLADGNEHVEMCDGQYRCRLCHYKSASAAIVGIHMRMHKEKPPSECSLCDFHADTSETLQVHMLQHCKLRTYQCRLCGCTFNYKSQLRAHMRAHTGTKLHVCRLCGFAAADAAALGSHMDNHVTSGEISHLLKGEEDQMEDQEADQLRDGDDADGIANTEQSEKSEKRHSKQHKCEACSFTSTSQTDLTQHQHQQHDEKELECELCEFVATSVRSLKSHMKRHINDQRFVLQPLEQYKCNLCGYVCHHLPSLKSHMWRHASDANYSYESTNNIINAAIDYDMQRCVKRPPKEYKCNMCGYVCYHLPSLKSHMWRHSSDQNYHYKFMTDDFLNSFALTELGRDGKHAGESMHPLVTFRCCQCGFESTDKAKLSDHMVVHTGDGQEIPKQENANISDSDFEMVAPDCAEEVTVTTCVQ